MRPSSDKFRSSILTSFKVQNTVAEANRADAVLSVQEQTSITPVLPIQTPVVINRRRRPRVQWATPVTATAERLDNDTGQLAEPTEECIVCRNMVSMPPDPPTSLCTHPSSVCQKCLIIIIENGVGGTIRCPTEGCRQELGYADVKKSTRGSKEEQATFDRYAHIC
jgi:hypothetical protein